MKECDAPWTAGAWREDLADAVTYAGELLRLLGLDDGPQAEIPSALRRFPLRVPRSFVDRMRSGDPDDPLPRQVPPLVSEDEPVTGFSADPVGELSAPPVDSVLHKYRGRALVMVTGACAVHCRYCFRRHYPYADHAANGETSIARLKGSLQTRRSPK